MAGIARWASALASSAAPAASRGAAIYWRGTVPGPRVCRSTAPVWSRRGMCDKAEAAGEQGADGKEEAAVHPFESPMPDPKAAGKQRVLYKKQLHELRVKYLEEKTANEEQDRLVKEAKMLEEKARKEAKMQAEAERKRLKRIWWEKKSRQIAKAKEEDRDHRYRDYLGKMENRRVKLESRFSTLCVESRAWASNLEEADAIAEEAILEPLPLHAAYAPVGNYGDRYGSY